MDMIMGWVGGFLLDHWVGVLIILLIVGVVIRVAYYASNPIAAVMDILEFLKKYWRETIIVGAIVGLASMFMYLRGEVAERDKQLAVAYTNIETLQKNNDKLEQAIKDANFATEKFDDFADDVRKRFDKLSIGVLSNNTALTKRIQDILKEKKPQSCEEAIDYLINARKEYAK